MIFEMLESIPVRIAVTVILLGILFWLDIARRRYRDAANYWRAKYARTVIEATEIRKLEE